MDTGPIMDESPLGLAGTDERLSPMEPSGRHVKPEVQRAMDAIDRVCETPTPKGPVELDAEYLETIRRVEALASNRDHADKTAVETAWLAWIHGYQSAIRRDP